MLTVSTHLKLHAGSSMTVAGPTGLIFLFSCPFGSWVLLWYFDTIRVSLMKPK